MTQTKYKTHMDLPNDLHWLHTQLADKIPERLYINSELCRYDYMRRIFIQISTPHIRIVHKYNNENVYV